jgi:hypothetical protein
MWPGGGFNYRGIVPKLHYAWNVSTSWETRVDLVMEWFVYLPSLTCVFSLVFLLYELNKAVICLMFVGLTVLKLFLNVKIIQAGFL